MSKNLYRKKYSCKETQEMLDIAKQIDIDKRDLDLGIFVMLSKDTTKLLEQTEWKREINITDDFIIFEPFMYD